jgi:hypothetical protein
MPISIFASENRVTGTDVAEIRTVIHCQAFRRDDAPSAFALVPPGVQQVRTNGCHLVQPTRIISA